MLVSYTRDSRFEHRTLQIQKNLQLAGLKILKAYYLEFLLISLWNLLDFQEESMLYKLLWTAILGCLER